MCVYVCISLLKMSYLMEPYGIFIFETEEKEMGYVG